MNNNPIPSTIGTIHFIGIGGIGMSGMATVLHNMGYTVQGSDLTPSYVTDYLEELGIKVFYGQHPDNIKDVSLVVRSTAVKDNNPEVEAAQQKHIPVIPRSDMLAELMRFKRAIAVSGTHGKTTTTSLIARVLETAKFDPTVINGGIINHVGSNAYNGSGNFLVAEADESDGTFIKIPAYIAVITNIDPEHLDYYGSFENVKKSYLQFITHLPFYGFAVLCFDHPVVREIAAEVTGRRLVSYGLTEPADVMAVNIQIYKDGSVFDVVVGEDVARRLSLPATRFNQVQLSIHGRHNIQNALAAIAVALELGISIEVIKEAFHDFKGVKRRFITTGEVNGVRIVDDYAHHPVEISATLAAARDVLTHTKGKLIAVVQPHRYSRLNDLMEEFAACVTAADYVLVSEVFAAGEQPIPGVDSQVLVAKMREKNNTNVEYLQDPTTLAAKVAAIAKSGDLVVCLGAGNITKWAYALPGELEKLNAKVQKYGTTG